MHDVNIVDDDQDPTGQSTHLIAATVDADDFTYCPNEHEGTASVNIEFVVK